MEAVSNEKETSVKVKGEREFEYRSTRRGTTFKPPEKLSIIKENNAAIVNLARKYVNGSRGEET